MRIWSLIIIYNQIRNAFIYSYKKRSEFLIVIIYFPLPETKILGRPQKYHPEFTQKNI